MLGRVLPQTAREIAKRAIYFGNRFHCPVCNSGIRRFVAAGDPPRAGARCPVCRALERHRLVWEFYRRRTSLFDGKPRRMLHIAPEPPLEPRLRKTPGLDYLSGDIDPRRAMAMVDITDIRFPESTFDVIHCSHVLEHVADDSRALREFRRVLAGNGFVVLQVPILAERTAEDPTVTDPAERRARFGQDDHVRIYGPDFADRVAEAGFHVDPLAASDILDPGEIEKMAIPAGELVFCCTRG